MDQGPQRERIRGTPREPLPALTGLRFLAALHVLLYHYLGSARPRVGGAVVQRVVEGVDGSGYLGVGLFFVLSGFILAYNYLAPDGPRPVPKRTFWMARLARVYPVYLFSLLVSAPGVWTWAHGKMLTEPLAIATAKVALVVSLNVSMLQAWLPHTVAPWNTPGWSLSVEVFFYALFPFVAPRFGHAAARRPGVAMAALWVASLVTPALYLLLSATPQLHQGDPEAAGMVLASVKYFPLFHLPAFLIGVVVGLRFLRAPRGDDASRVRWGRVADLTAVGYLALLVATPSLPYPLLHDGLFLPVFASLILALASGDGWLSRALATPVGVLLGGASYALYLLHLPLLGYVDRVGAVVGYRPASAFTRAGIGAVVALALSIAVLQLLEEPARRWLRARSGVSRHPAALSHDPEPSPTHHDGVGNQVAAAATASADIPAPGAP